MSGIRRRARAWSRVALALCAFAVPFAANGVAAANPSGITPILECVAVNGSGAYTAVLGYSNPSDTVVTVQHGASNKFTPTHYDGDQPTTFLPGRQRGVFSLTVDHPSVKWKLDSSTLRLDRDATRCPPSTEMPEQGNGTGIAVGLLAGGVIGVFLIRRLQRRLTAEAAASSSSSTTHTGPEADDA